MRPEDFMREALAEAEAAFAEGEVPIGAVVVKGGSIIGRGHNEVEAKRDATLHAEILAMRQASAALGDWRLAGCRLYVTLEPCAMCMGAMVLARLPELCFGAYDPRQGACGSLFHLGSDVGLPHEIEVYPEVLAAECAALLARFFEQFRKA